MHVTTALQCRDVLPFNDVLACSAFQERTTACCMARPDASQPSSGGKSRLGCITKANDQHLHTL